MPQHDPGEASSWSMEGAIATERCHWPVVVQNVEARTGTLRKNRLLKQAAAAPHGLVSYSQGWCP
jgi:hypothetical protein